MDHDFLRDPKSLPVGQRRMLLGRHAGDQAHWLDRLRRLAETRVDADFPAFLLALPPFAELRDRIGGAQCRADLTTAVADEVDWFVTAYRDYLRTSQGEDVFAGARRAC